METSYALLWLEAPLQSWGANSVFYRRSTLDFPTKSGILGLLLCGMGAIGKQNYLLENFVSLDQSVISFKRDKRIDENIPLLEDFQMVGSGYDEKDSWESMLIPKNCKGKKSVGGGSKLTYKYYLQDAFFAVIMEIPNHMKLTVEKALVSPHYDLYLGRKSCIATDFIYRGIYPSEDIAKKKALKIAEEKKLVVDFEVLDGIHDGKVMYIKDVPLQFGDVKKYIERQVTIVRN